MKGTDYNIDYYDGAVLLFDKPVGWTSFDVVNKVRQLIRRNRQGNKIKVGHAGTLDPLASGLMIICTGKATKGISGMQLMEKEYIATIEFGKSTPSYDLETEFNAEYPFMHITEESLRLVLDRFRGNIEQVPPLYSAKHHNGSRAYELARKGEASVLRSQQVEIHELELISFRLPEVSLRVRCSKGTYIRSLAHDLGVACQSGAYLKSLRRTAIPPYRISEAFSLEEFEDILVKNESN